MNWEEFTAARRRLADKGGYKDNLGNLERLLGVSANVSPSWKPRGIPAYIEYSIEALELLNTTALKSVAKKRGIQQK